MKRIAILILLLFFSIHFISCGNKTKVRPVVGSTEMKSKTGKVYKITEYISEDSVSHDYTIRGIGFKNSNDSIEITKQFPIFNTLFADLDSNGFEELYLITKTGKSGFIKILGIASYNDSVFKEIVTAPYDSIKLADKR